MDAQIAKTTQDLTTAAEMRATTQMLMQPNTNWEEYLAPAPLSIAIMGELVFISSATDFSINKDPPKDGFKYIKYPESFRACLMQVCNSGWQAFNTAHKNMDQIRIHTSTVPNYMKEAVKMLFQGNDEVVKALLPNQLANIGNISDECVKLALGVEQKYSDVINLIEELLEACINAGRFYGEELENIKRKIEENKMREQAARELNEMSKKAMDTMSKEMEEAKENFKRAMDSVPSGWEILGMNLVQEVGQAVTALVSIVGSCKPNTASPNVGSSASQADHDNRQDMVSDMVVCIKSGQILNLAASLGKFISDEGINWREIYDQKKKCVKTSWIKDQFKRIFRELEKLPNSKLNKSALSLCEEGITICGELEKYSPDQKWHETTTKELIKKTKKLNEDALKFDSKSKKRSGSPALTPKPPMMNKTESSGHQSVGVKVLENAHLRIEQSREQLKQSRELYATAVQNMEKNQKELNEILIEMQKCNVKEIDFDTTLKMLAKGMDAMGRVKEQWKKMVRFFQMMANIVKTSLGPTLKNFVVGANQTMTLSYNNKLFAKDMLYNQAFQASNIASLVHMISGTYCEVSNKYLMDRVSSLGRLMVMEKENPEFSLERQRLQVSCKEAQEGILQLVLKNKKEFEMKTDARMAQIEGGLKAILPAASPQETERIKEIVQTAFAEEEAEDYY